MGYIACVIALGYTRTLIRVTTTQYYTYNNTLCPTSFELRVFLMLVNSLIPATYCNGGYSIPGTLPF